MNELLNIKMSENETIKSNELVVIINEFRRLEFEALKSKGLNKKDDYTKLQHDNFLKKIRKEIETLRAVDLFNPVNIYAVKYIDEKGEERECFELNRNGMLQILNSESAVVRYKTIEYIDRLENEVKALKEKSKYELLIEKQEEQIQRIEMCVSIKDRHKKMYGRYIKNKLGIIRINKDYNMIKKDLFNKFNIDKWEDLAVIEMNKVFDSIDESIEFINKYKQLEMEIKEK